MNLHLAELTMKLAGRPYALNEAVGLDCFSSICTYLAMRGVEIPEEFEGYSVTDYKDLFLSDPEMAKELMVKLVESLLDEIDPHFSMAGDVLLAKPKEAESSKDQADVVGPLSALRSTLRALSSPLYASLFLAIHGGNGSMLGATIERGLVPLPIRAFDVLRAFRVREGGT